MSDIISQYINTEKKLKIRIEKILSTLYLAKFSGTVTVINGDEVFNIIISEEKAYCDRSIMSLAGLPENTLFNLKSVIPENFKSKLKEYQLLEFIFRIVENIDRFHITALLKPFAAEYFSIRPETGQLVFLYNELEPFIGHKKIEIFSNFKKNYRTIFFLLITRFANILKSTDAERAEITEKLNRSNMFDEKIKDEESLAQGNDNSKTEEENLVDYLNTHEKFKDILHIFGLSSGFEEKLLHKEYLRIVQRVHPDKLQNVSIVTKDRAEKFLRIVSESYELLKNPVERAEVEKLMKKYGPIKTRTDFTKLKEYDEAMFKGTALLRLGSFEAAAEVFEMIFQQTKNPEALEKKILAIWKKSPRWNEAEKTVKYPPIKEDILKLKMFKDPDLELLFILAEIFEFFKQIPDCMKVLSVITQYSPDNFRAQGMKKRLMYYDSLNKTKK